MRMNPLQIAGVCILSFSQSAASLFTSSLNLVIRNQSLAETVSSKMDTQVSFYDYLLTVGPRPPAPRALSLQARITR